MLEKKLDAKLLQTYKEVIQKLEELGTEQTRKIWRNHGAREPMFGVQIGDMKRYLVNKATRNNTQLALELYKTGNCDAMYLAGLIVNPKELTKKELNDWAVRGNWYMISEYTVASVCAKSRYAPDLVHKWIAQEKKESVCSSGWSAYCHYIPLADDISLEFDIICRYLDFCRDKIHIQLNRVKYTMNNFVISVGSYIPQLKKEALQVAKDMGHVDVYVGQTSCKVPNAHEYIEKVWKRKKTRK